MTKSSADGQGCDADAPLDLDGLGFGFELPDDAWLGRLRTAEVPIELGRVGDYELLQEVSRGGQGVVYRAREQHTKRVTALKRLIAGSFAGATSRLRFEREIEAAAALNHPGIVTVYGMEIEGDVPFLAMEWIDGLPITSWATTGARATGEVLDTFLALCDAVAHAHARGVLHRDLKPSNVLVDVQGQPHVLDFGLARRIDSSADGPAGWGTLTGTCDFLGTPAYAAPEQFRGAPPEQLPGAPPEQLRGDPHGPRDTHVQLDARADVYSLGVMLFELLTGASPYGSFDSVVELVRSVTERDPPRPSQVHAGIDRELDAIVLKALSKDRDERYATVDAFATDLRRHLAGEPILAVEPSSWTLVRKLARRHRSAVAVAALMLVMIAGFATFATWQALRLKTQRDDAEFARREAFEGRVLAEEAARELERLLLSWMERGEGAGTAPRGVRLEPTGAPGSWIAVEPASWAAPARCFAEKATPNPNYERDALRAPVVDGPRRIDP